MEEPRARPGYASWGSVLVVAIGGCGEGEVSLRGFTDRARDLEEQIDPTAKIMTTINNILNSFLFLTVNNIISL